MGVAVVVLVATVLILIAAEAAVRVRQWIRYGTLVSYDQLYYTDPALNLRVLKAGARVGAIGINALGFRGPEIPREKPERRIRIGFIGASTTYCAEVSSDAATWPHIVTEMLRQRYPGLEFDYVNGGVPGYRIESSLTNLRHRLTPLRPDVLVIYHATNDLSAELRMLATAQGIFDAADLMTGWIDRYSLFYELVRKNLRVMIAERQGPNPDKWLSFDARRLGSGFGVELSRIVREARAVAPVVAMATFSTQLRPGQDEARRNQAAVSARVVMPFMTVEGLIDGYARYNEVIRDVGRSGGVLLIEGENDIPGDMTHFVDTVHFTDAGSRLMAERVFRALVAAPEMIDLVSKRQR